jgi:hypothetical protein
MSCGINPLSWGDCVGDELSKQAGNLASSGFDGLANAFAKGVGDIVATLATFWTATPTTSLSTASGSPVGMLTSMLDWIMLAVGLIAILLVAVKMGLTQRGDAFVEGSAGVGRFVLVQAAQVPAIAALAVGGDLFSAWVLNVASGGNFGARVTQVFGTVLVSGPQLGSALIFICALLTILASIAQVIAMVARNGVLIVTAAATPLAGAAAISKGGEAFWRKVWMWQLAFVLYKPTAAVIYAAAFVTVADGKTTSDVLTGLAMMILSVLAMPALLRLMMPVSAKIGGGGGGAAMLGAAAAASGVAGVLSGRGRSGGGGGGGTGGPSANPAGGGPTGASATASAAKAAGPVAAGLQAVGAAKQAMDATASSATGENQ